VPHLATNPAAKAANPAAKVAARPAAGRHRRPARWPACARQACVHAPAAARLSTCMLQCVPTVASRSPRKRRWSAAGAAGTAHPPIWSYAPIAAANCSPQHHVG